MSHTHIWERDSRHEFTMVDADNRTICSIARSYQQRRCSSGAAYECNDTEKPMVWRIMIPGRDSKILAHLHMDVRKAKEVAEFQVRRLGLVKDSQD